MQTSSQSPCLLKVNPEPSRNPFCQARDFGGLHVEIPNQQARLSTSNYTQLSQSKLLSISISTLITIQNNQMHEPTGSNWQHTPNRRTTIRESPKLGSSISRQKHRGTPQANDTHPSITKMGRILRDRCPKKSNLLTSKPSPLTPHPGRDQSMLNNRQKINLSL